MVLVRDSFPGIDSWVQSWVSWVEPGLPRKPSSLTQKTQLSWVHQYSYVVLSWVSCVLKNCELGLAGLAGFSKIMSWVNWVSWVLKNYKLGLAG